MRIKWKHLSSKEKDELIGEAVKALVELSKGEPHVIPTRMPNRYHVVETNDFVLHWAVYDEEMEEVGGCICHCVEREDADLICEALNRSQTCL